MPQYALEIENLTKIYRGRVHALKGINFNVEKGDFFALLGPNGAGKSTTIGITCSLVNKTSGQIRVMGYDLDREPNVVKKHIGLVPQEFNFNIFEQVQQILITQAGFYGIPRKEARKRSEHYLQLLDLWDKRDEIAQRLSGGMKRRLMIARALIHEPPLLILDEPTAGVDIELRRLTWDLLRHLNSQGVTIILTTHYLEEAETLCRNIAIIDQGEVIECTRVKELLNRLNSETFIFYLLSPLPANANFDQFPTHILDETTLEIELNKNQSLNQIFTMFAEQGVQIHSMRNKTNRLEELFVQLVRENKTENSSRGLLTEQILNEIPQ